MLTTASGATSIWKDSPLSVFTCRDRAMMHSLRSRVLQAHFTLLQLHSCAGSWCAIYDAGTVPPKKHHKQAFTHNVNSFFSIRNTPPHSTLHSRLPGSRRILNQVTPLYTPRSGRPPGTHDASRSRAGRQPRLVRNNLRR